jgi:hypothetical protein
MISRAGLFPDFKHFGAARRAGALRGRLAVFHGNGFKVVIH